MTTEDNRISFVQALRKISQAADLPRPLVDVSLSEDGWSLKYPASVDRIMLDVVIEKLEATRAPIRQIPGQLSFDFDS